MEIQEPINWRKLDRVERGKLIFQNHNIKKVPQGWRVHSQTNPCIDYIVKFKRDNPICTCPDCEIAKKKCKHIYAVEYYIKQEIDEEGKLSQTKGIKITYGQQWKAYDTAQTNEKLLFMKLLRDLCDTMEQPSYIFGRPKLPYSDMVFSSAMKVYTTFSLRRFMSDMKIAKEMNLTDEVPCFASVGHFLQKEELTPILKDLIKISATPLSSIETDFAVDSSGFSTYRFARYFDYKYGRETKYRIWLKAHLISGVKTNIVTGAEITEGRVNDSPQLSSLVVETSKRFNMQEVSCDRAYSSRENLSLIKEVGAMPFIPFKKNASAKIKGSLIWKKMYYYFMYKHEEFLQHYHKRSNAETVFYMIKTKFKDNLRSKSKTAQINELLCKVLCHNICCVIQEISELGIKGEFVVEEKK